MAAPPRDQRHKPHFHRNAPVKEPVRVATTANLTISTGLNAGDTVDGVTLAADDRVLVKDQSTANQNGIYVAGATPARAYDFSTDGAEVPGALVVVLEGSVGAGKVYRCTNATAPTFDTTAIAFEEIGGAAGASALDDLTDVTITAPAEDDDLRYDGATWVNDARKWEVVTDGEDVFVWEGDGLVYEWST